MKKMNFLVMALLAMCSFVFPSCNECNCDPAPVVPSVNRGSVTFEFVGASGAARMALNTANTRMVATISGKEYSFEAGTTMLLPLGEQVITSFDVYMDNKHRYVMVGDEQRFTVLGDRINKVKVYVIDVQEVDTDGDVELEVTVSPYEAIKSGMNRVVTRYEGSNVGPVTVLELVQAGFPTIRFDNGSDKNRYFELYKNGGNGQVINLRVNAGRQTFLNVKERGTYIVKWNGGSKTISL